MAGSMAGTAILECPPHTRALYAVGLAINNLCNLACPHCYLQYDSAHAYVARPLLNNILADTFDVCCVVGKEPLANQASIDLLDEICAVNAGKGRRTSIITNGHHLTRLPASVVRRLSWIDVSLDAGINAYRAVRGRSPEPILAGARYVNDISPGLIRALFTIHAGNIGDVAGMLQFARAIGASKWMFSPYQRTDSDGVQSASMVSAEMYLDTLARYMPAEEAGYVAIDVKYVQRASGSPTPAEVLADLVARYDGAAALVVTDRDPLHRGILRVTHDGLALRPFDSIDARYYFRKGVPIQGRTLSGIFQEFRHSDECEH